MSTEGALVEAAAIPERGSAVRLIRGRFVVPAEVVWTAEGRCGLRFSSFVTIQDWLAPPANKEQQRVDDTVRLVKAGAVPLAGTAHCSDTAHPAQLGHDLRGAARLLERLGDDLASDEAVLARHVDELQNMDIALQTIAAVANLFLRDADEVSTASRLENLRVSCEMALTRPHLGNSRSNSR